MGEIALKALEGVEDLLGSCRGTDPVDGQTWRGCQSFLPWLYRIAYHGAIDLWRYRPYVTLLPLEERPDGNHSSDQ